MATRAQIEANRRNAQKSTGPRSPEGKAASCRNALKSGIDAQSQILPGEDSSALEALTAEYYERYRPATPEARHLVDTLISNEWLLRRFRRVEVQMVQHEMQSAGPFLDKKNAVGHSYMRSDRSLDRLQRRINAAERNYHRALKELQALPPEIGFVPQTASEPELPAPAPDPCPRPDDTEMPLAAVPPIPVPAVFPDPPL